MSTVAYRDGVMASDTRGYSGNRQPVGRKVKCHALEGGALIGVTSTTPGQADHLVRLLRDDPEGWDTGYTWPKDWPPNFTALLVRPDGSAYLYEDSTRPSGPLEADYYAIGSGGDYALGAMHRGATAEEAVETACVLDVWSELPLTVREHRT